MSCQSNSTAVCHVVHYIKTEAPELQLIKCALVARYYDISSKADRGDIFIIHKNCHIAHPLYTSSIPSMYKRNIHFCFFFGLSSAMNIEKIPATIPAYMFIKGHLFHVFKLRVCYFPFVY